MSAEQRHVAIKLHWTTISFGLITRWVKAAGEHAHLWSHVFDTLTSSPHKFQSCLSNTFGSCSTDIGRNLVSSIGINCLIKTNPFESCPANVLISYTLNRCPCSLFWVYEPTFPFCGALAVALFSLGFDALSVGLGRGGAVPGSH